MAQKGNSCSHQQRASHLWQCLKWKHEEEGGKSGGTLKGISPIYFAVTCFSRKELTAEFYISPGKAAAFFWYEKKKNKTVHAVFSSRNKAKILHLVNMVPFLSFLMDEGELVLFINYMPIRYRHSSYQMKCPTMHLTEVTTALKYRKKVRNDSQGIVQNWVFVAEICSHETTPCRTKPTAEP